MFSLASAAFVTLVWVRRLSYLVFFYTHFWVAVLAAVALLRHLAVQRPVARLYILTGIASGSFLLAVGSILDCLRNIRPHRGHWLPKISAEKVYRTADDDQIVMTDAYHVDLWVNRSCKVYPGQFLYLSVPWLGLPSLLQSHPFWIVWWDEDTVRGGMNLQMLVRQRDGFTRHLLSCRGQTYSAWIRGPYGQTRNLAEFGTVLMFATDIGIAAHLPYLRALIHGYAMSSVCTRRAVVIWDVKDGSELLLPLLTPCSLTADHYKWTKNWFDQLLAEDTSLVSLRCSVRYRFSNCRYSKSGFIALETVAYIPKAATMGQKRCARAR